jgi:hypothetical protein
MNEQKQASMTLNKVLNFYQEFKQCEFDSGIAGAIGELYAIEKLGMIKAPRGEKGFDGWINGRKVSVKTKEPKTRGLSAIFAPVRNSVLGLADDLLVVSIAEDNSVSHMMVAFDQVVGRPHASGTTRFYLNDIKKALEQS